MKDNKDLPSSVINTSVTAEDLLNAVTDNYNVSYSYDGKRLLRTGDNDLELYDFKPTTEVICDNAFNGRYDIMEMELPDSLIAIGDHTFQDVHNLKILKLPKRVTTIGDEAFADCKSLWSVKLSEALTHIGKRAFANCIFGNITIPKGVTVINGGTFSGCTSLMSVRILGDIKYFSEDVFDGCNELENIYVQPSCYDLIKNKLPDVLKGKLKKFRSQSMKTTLF